MESLEEILIENPIIAAIRNDKALGRVLNSDILIVFVLYGNIINIQEICEKLKRANKLVFVHMDMIEGLKADIVGIEFLKKFAGPYGVITTKATNVKHAKKLGFCTIQRIFMIDSLSLDTGIRNITDVMPNAVEVMPGVVTSIISKIQEAVHVPVIAGGLIKTKKDVLEALSSGAEAISTSEEDLWRV